MSGVLAGSVDFGCWPVDSVRLGVGLWQSGLPLDVLPGEGSVELPLTLESED